MQGPTSRLRYCLSAFFSLTLLFSAHTVWAHTDHTAESEGQNYGLQVYCPDDVIVACGDHYYDELPLPEVHTDCDYCYGGNISGFIYMGSWNGHKYYCSKEKMTWQDAKAYCESKGGHLAVVGSSQENHFLANLLQAESAYIGLSDHEQEGHWKWINGDPVNYSNWYYNQPNNYYNKQHYVELLKSGYWNDQYYYKPLEFIMELPCYTITKTKDKYTHYGSEKTRHIEYKVKDACGRVEWCEFSIKYKDETKLWCPGNIEAVTKSGSAVVTWNNPVFETCCTDCSHSDHISGYIYMGSWGGSRYYCSKQKYTWHQAKSRCEAYGGHLAVINDAGENAYLASKLQANYAFIGVSDHHKEGKWMTVKNTPCTYYNWYPGEPDNTWGKQHYVEMNKYGYWNDQYGDKKREYIMEIPHCQQVVQVEGLPPGSEFPVGHHKIVYKAKDGCGNEDYCSFYVKVKPEHSDAHYCEIWGKRTDKGYIDRVSLNNKWFNTGSNGGYYNHHNYCVSVYQGQYLYIKLRPGYYHSYHKAYWKIYLDRNGDGDFKDAYEYIAKGSGYGTLSAKIPISQHVKAGKTRLRVIMKIGGYASYTCGKYEYGETEDFCIYVRDHKSQGDEVTGKEFFEPLELATEPSELVVTDIRLHPNPASSEVMIRAAGIDAIEEVSFYSTSGQLIKQVRIDGSTALRVGLEDVTPGLYVVRLIDTGGKIHFDKLVVQ